MTVFAISPRPTPIAFAFVSVLAVPLFCVFCAFLRLLRFPFLITRSGLPDPVSLETEPARQVGLRVNLRR
jgi:hypothetical protein